MDVVPKFNPQSVDDVDIIDQRTFCPICQVQCENIYEFDEHNNQKSHWVALCKAWLATHLDDCLKEKFGITIICKKNKPHADGSLHFYTLINKETKYSLIVKNNGYCPVLIQDVDFLKDMKIATLHDDLGNATDGQFKNFGVTKSGKKKRFVRLEHDAEHEIILKCKSQYVNMYYIPIVFQFVLDAASQFSFQIVRFLGLHFVSGRLNKLDNESEFKAKKKKAVRGGVKVIVPGKPLPKSSQKTNNLQLEVNLKNYYPPKNLRRICKLRDWKPDDQRTIDKLTPGQLNLMENVLDLFENGLTKHNFRKYMAALLHIEECQILLELEEYDIENGVFTMEKIDKDIFYELEVPGLKESRPSVLRGDKIYARRVLNQDVLDSTEYEGIVHVVRRTTLVVGFDKDFNWVFNNRSHFYVRFSIPRKPLRYMHRALDYIQPFQYNFLFPDEAEDVPSSRPLRDITSFTPYNNNIGTNDEQTQAVVEILRGSFRPFPYLLFGPPGTGKTMTLVEAITQVWKCYPASRILICAPSNSACDTVTERLMEGVIPANQIFRMHASSREEIKVSENVMRCSNYNAEEKCFFFPDKREIVKYRIVVATLVTTGRFVVAAFPQNHFTHLFIDEAGQSLEPESLIPIIGLMTMHNKPGGIPGGCIILAGDPKQLGPVLRTRYKFIRHGLQTSLLERLMMTCSRYQRQANGHFNPQFMTKLVRNYRTNEFILKLPNELFYDEELIPCAEAEIVNSLFQWSELPTKNFPLFFHGVMGREKQEALSPSYYNPEEVCTVMDYVSKLLKISLNKVAIRNSDIGIISPYRKQVEKIKSCLDQDNIVGIQVGSTEEFQGQEKRVIIITTARSNANVMAMDVELRLGFLKNAKRFNVAVTRAKALLIIIGNPYILIKDDHWGRLLQYCIDNGAYRGCHFDGPDLEAEDIYARFERLHLVPDCSDLTFGELEDHDYRSGGDLGYYE